MTHAAPPPPHDAGWYEIRLQGRLDPRWSAWLDGMDLAPDGDGTTVLRGRVVDQAALHGLLARLRDLGLPLISVARVDPTTAAHRRPRHPPPSRHTRPETDMTTTTAPSATTGTTARRPRPATRRQLRPRRAASSTC